MDRERPLLEPDTDFADDRAHRKWPWHRRLASAVARRARAWRRRSGERLTLVESAVAWLNRQDRSAGLPAHPGGPPCPRLTAAMLPTLLEFGQMKLLDCWLHWLLSVQAPDGSLPARTGGDGAMVNSATTLCSLTELRLAGIGCCETLALHSAAFLSSALTQLVESEISLSDRGRAATALYGAAALHNAAQPFSRDAWRHTAAAMLARLRCEVDWHSWNNGSRLSLLAAEAWTSVGELELAREMVSWWSVHQHRDGSLPAADVGEGSEALAQITVLWYRLGEHDRADRAMAFLNRQTRCDRPWMVKHYLDAARLQVSVSFERPSTLPTTIAPNDGRLLAVRDWLASLGPAARVADVGCGSGRFLRDLSSRVEEATFVGVDPSSAMLAELPPGIERRPGSLLRIPAADGEFDGAFAVESLEHSLLPEKAVEELCRVVRPGGKILILDKHRHRQRLSLYQPWEQWFLPETVVRWLTRHCSDVQVQAVAHGDAKLFLCWRATRRSAAYDTSGNVPRLARNSLISPAA